jgi:hypothetical protein
VPDKQPSKVVDRDGQCPVAWHQVVQQEPSPTLTHCVAVRPLPNTTFTYLLLSFVWYRPGGVTDRQRLTNSSVGRTRGIWCAQHLICSANSRELKPVARWRARPGDESACLLDQGGRIHMKALALLVRCAETADSKDVRPQSVTIVLSETIDDKWTMTVDIVGC